MLVLSSSYSKRKWNQFISLKGRKEQTEYLLKGKITAVKWYDMKNNKDFYRPAINGLCVMMLPEREVESMKDFIKFDSADEAIKYGNECYEQLQKDLAELI